MFGDGQYVSGADKYMRAPFPNPGDLNFSGRYAGTQGYRHQGKTNVAYCDGHVEPVAKRYTDDVDYPAGDPNVSATTGFLSADNRLYGAQ
jgi:prepilin-type processing-associated H-X9-DG protein